MTEKIFKVATTQVLGISLAVALVDKSYIGSPAGDELLGRLALHFRPQPAMLVAADGDAILAHAPFQTERIAEALGDQDLDWREIDLGRAPPEQDEPLPF